MARMRRWFLGSPTLLALGQVVGASVASRLLRLVKVLAVARLLSPDSYGVFGAVVALVTYAQFLDLGTASAAYRDLASAAGRRDEHEMRLAAGRMATVKLAGTVLLGAVALALAWWPGLRPDLRPALLALPAIAVSWALQWLLLQQLQAEGRIAEYSRATAWIAGADLLLCVGMTALWSLPGLLVASALAPLPALAWAVRHGALALPRAVPRETLARYLRSGLPLAGLTMVDQTLLSLDQLLIMSLLSVRALGLYNVALVPAEALRTLALAGGAVFGPRLLREYARVGSLHSAIRVHALNPPLLYAAVLPVLSGPLWILLSYGLVSAYPAYAEALLPMHLLIVGANFIVVVNGVTSFLFAIDRHARNFYILVPAVCLNVALDLVLLRRGLGLTAIAVGSLVTYFVYAAAHLAYVTSHFEPSARGRLGYLTRALLPTIAFGTAMSIVERLVDYRHSLALAVATAAGVGLVCAPAALHALRLARQLDEAGADSAA
jgi:O-antigen/teichoic acid export membrane protein